MLGVGARRLALGLCRLRVTPEVEPCEQMEPATGLVRRRSEQRSGPPHHHPRQRGRLFGGAAPEEPRRERVVV